MVLGRRPQTKGLVLNLIVATVLPEKWDLVTVWGKKASSEGVIPDEYYAGDRVAFVESQHAEAKGALIGGICMLALAPIVLVGGILSAVFGKR